MFFGMLNPNLRYLRFSNKMMWSNIDNSFWVQNGNHKLFKTVHPVQLNLLELLNYELLSFFRQQTICPKRQSKIGKNFTFRPFQKTKSKFFQFFCQYYKFICKNTYRSCLSHRASLFSVRWSVGFGPVAHRLSWVGALI